MVIDSLPSVLWRLVTLFRLPRESVSDLEINSLPSALRRLVTLLRLPKSSVTDLEIDSLPSELRLLVTLLRLPKTSVPVFVMVTESPPNPCAEAVPAHVRETASAAARTAIVFMTAFPLGFCTSHRRHINHLTFHNSCDMTDFTLGLLLRRKSSLLLRSSFALSPFSGAAHSGGHRRFRSLADESVVPAARPLPSR